MLLKLRKILSIKILSIVEKIYVKKSRYWFMFNELILNKKRKFEKLKFKKLLFLINKIIK